MNKLMECRLCNGPCRLVLGHDRRDTFKMWANHEENKLRRVTVPEMFTLLKKYFRITGVRVP